MREMLTKYTLAALFHSINEESLQISINHSQTRTITGFNGCAVHVGMCASVRG